MGGGEIMPQFYSTDSFNMGERGEYFYLFKILFMYSEVLTLIVILLIIKELRK